MAVTTALTNVPDNANIGAFQDGYIETLVSGQTVTATDQSAVFTLPYIAVAGKAKLVVTITAISGTSPTLQIDLFETTDGTHFNGTAALTSGSLNATGTTWTAVASGPICPQMQLKATVGGTTPSVTFSAYLVVWNR